MKPEENPINTFEKENQLLADVRREVGKVVVGLDQLVERLLISMLCSGHVLIEGIPGLAKTLTISTLAQVINVDFSRIQFTPDLLPGDLIGTLVYNQKTGEFTPHKGPVFSNLVLADEINRSPAKVQSALLEAMQERQVTIHDTTFKLDDPFLVFATQNPIDQEGTYPLPEAQVDRFMLKLKVDYPSDEEEMQILKRMGTSNGDIFMKSIVNPKTILNARAIVNEIYTDEKIEKYIVDLVLATRSPERFGLGEISELISYGASPRATIYLAKASRARAFLQKRGYVIPEDVRYIAEDILRHRLILTYEAEAEEVTTEDLIQRLFDTIPVP